jgi:branched-chain amino acid transport system substrate-binding protein
MAVRGLALAVVGVVIGGAGSCGGTGAGGNSSSVTVSGATLKVYASVPSGTPDGSDILAAERLAVSQESPQAGKYRIKFVPLSSTRLSDNARVAIEDAGAIAYIGELQPGASADSVGITNGEDLLQVSPGDTALELTQASPALPGTPGEYYESLKTYGRTFARVVPSTALEARAQVQEMQALGVKKLYVASDGSPYGAATAAAVRSAAAALSPVEGAPSAGQVQASGADAVFYAAAPGGAAAAARVLSALAGANSTLKLFVPSSLDRPALASTLGAAKVQLYASAPGFLAADLPAAGQAFLSAFRQAYGHAPAPAAIFAYEAAKAVFDVLHEAGAAAGSRGAVVHDFFAISNRSSALGSYSINANGDTTVGPYVFSRLKGGRFVPFKFIEIRG